MEHVPYSPDDLMHGIKIAIAGSRQCDSDVVEERILTLMLRVQRTAYENGLLTVRCAIKDALGIK